MADKIKKIQETLEQMLFRAVELGRDKAIKSLRERVKTGRDSKGSMFSAYSDSHKRRRTKENLQTTVKDLHFSSTMFDNFKETKREYNNSAFRATIVIGFEGAAKRRKDQKAASNKQVAEWLSDQEDISIVKLSDSEIKSIKDAIIAEFKGEIGKIDIT